LGFLFSSSFLFLNKLSNNGVLGDIIPVSQGDKKEKKWKI
jgi:hypothetical protein